MAPLGQLPGESSEKSRSFGESILLPGLNEHDVDGDLHRHPRFKTVWLSCRPAT